MNKLWGLILLLSLVSFQTTVCYGAQYWAKAYGLYGADLANSIQETTDGGYIIAGDFGFEYPNFDHYVWVLKLDSNGNIVWQKTYGGSDSGIANSIQETTDGGYVVAGATASFGAGSGDVWVLKLDSNGNIVWQKTYGGSRGDIAYSIQKTTDGGYVVAGKTKSFGDSIGDVLIIKLDSNGNVIWQKTYGGSSLDIAYSIQETTDGSYVVAGQTLSFGAGNNDVWVLKLDSNGNIVWQKTYGGAGSESAKSIQETTDGGYVVTGTNGSFSAHSNSWTIKLDSNGTVLWQKIYGENDDEDSMSSIQETTDGGYVVAGATASFGAGSGDVWVLKLDSNGNVVWQKTYGGTRWDRAFSIQETTDGGYVVAGYTESVVIGPSGIFVLRLDSNGEIPNCNIVGTSEATIIDIDISGQDTSATIADISVTPNDTTVTPTDSLAITVIICSGDPSDPDNDGIIDVDDNCPDTSNPEQTDSYPEGGNDCGDACECEGNFNPDEDDDVDGSDAAIFKADFGRAGYNDPCESGNTCNGDFDCDSDVDGTDASLFKSDFGRGGYNNPCPSCPPTDPWCVYP